MRIAVAGATGRVGKHLVDALNAKGHDVVQISRSSGVDVITGKGLAAALAGVERVVDATSGPSPDQSSATEFFTTASRNLQEVGAPSGVKRIIVVSIIGIDSFAAGYMAAKVAHEKAMAAGPIPIRIVRAAQFHELVPQLIEWGRQGDVSYIQKMRTQLVAAKAVAQVLADLAADPAPDRAGAPIQEIAGPRAEELVDVATRFVARRDVRVRVVAVSNPTDPDRNRYELGALLPGPNATLAGPTFDEWLESSSAFSA